MKSPFLITLVAFISISIFSISCNKDEEDSIKEITEEKIEGRWIIDSVVIIRKVNGNETRSLHIGETDEYIEFMPDGTMKTFFVGNTNTSKYVVRDDKSISINGDSVYIIELTSNKFTYTTYADAGPLGNMTISYYLRR